jgi:hypothetical protein
MLDYREIRTRYVLFKIRAFDEEEAGGFGLSSVMSGSAGACFSSRLPIHLHPPIIKTGSLITQCIFVLLYHPNFKTHVLAKYAHL